MVSPSCYCLLFSMPLTGGFCFTPKQLQHHEDTQNMQCAVAQNERRINQWTNIVKWTLRYFPPNSISNDLRQTLLCEDDIDNFDYNFDYVAEADDFCPTTTTTASKSLQSSSSCLFSGIPRRPLFREIAYRLFLWNKVHQQRIVVEAYDDDNNSHDENVTINNSKRRA